MTLTEMQTFVRRRLDDAASAGNRWTDANITAELNNAYRFVAMDGELMKAFPRMLTATQTLSIVAGTTVYALTAGLQLIRRIMRTDVTPNVECHEVWYDDAPDWIEAGRCFDSEGRVVYYLDTNTTPVHTLTLPADPQQAMTLVVTYMKTPTELSSGSDVPDLPVLLHALLPLHVLSVLPESLNRDEAAAEYSLRKKQAMEFMLAKKRKTYVRDTWGIC